MENKWYSIREYTPPGACDLVVYCDFYCWDKLMIARYDPIEQKFYLINDDPEKTEDKKQQVDISHFMMIPPIPPYEEV